MKSYRVYKRVGTRLLSADVYVKGVVLINTDNIYVALCEYIKYSSLTDFVYNNPDNLALLDNKHTKIAFLRSQILTNDCVPEGVLIDFDMRNNCKLPQCVIDKIKPGMEYVVNALRSPNIIKVVIDKYFPNDLETRYLVRDIDNLNYLEVSDLIDNKLFHDTPYGTIHLQNVIYNICTFPPVTTFRDYITNNVMIESPPPVRETVVHHNHISFNIYRLIDNKVVVDNIHIIFPKTMKVNGLTLYELPPHIIKFVPRIEQIPNKADLYTLVDSYLYINGIPHEHIDKILQIEDIDEHNYTEKILSYLRQ